MLFSPKHLQNCPLSCIHHGCKHKPHFVPGGRGSGTSGPLDTSGSGDFTRNGHRTTPPGSRHHQPASFRSGAQESLFRVSIITTCSPGDVRLLSVKQGGQCDCFRNVESARASCDQCQASGSLSGKLFFQSPQNLPVKHQKGHIGNFLTLI